MSFFRKILGVGTIDRAAPEELRAAEESSAVLLHERQELRQKIQRVQSASRVFGTIGGAMQMMERDRGRD